MKEWEWWRGDGGGGRWRRRDEKGETGKKMISSVLHTFHILSTKLT